MLDLIECQANSAAVQRFIAAACLQREITATGARIRTH